MSEPVRRPAPPRLRLSSTSRNGSRSRHASAASSEPLSPSLRYSAAQQGEWDEPDAAQYSIDYGEPAVAPGQGTYDEDERDAARNDYGFHRSNGYDHSASYDDFSIPPVPPLPPHLAHLNTPNGFANHATLTPQALLARLEALLQAKSQEIQLAGQLGNSLLEQQAELEARIAELEAAGALADVGPGAKERRDRERTPGAHDGPHSGEGSEDETGEVSEETRRKVEELEGEMRRWQEGNEEIWRKARGEASDALVNSVSRPSTPPSHPFSLPAATPQPGPTLFSPGRPLPPSHTSPLPAGQGLGSSQSSNRRARNAQHRANDIEFATEIGQSLLGEVRRLQALVAELEGKLRESKEEREGLWERNEGLSERIRILEDNVDKFKEENWNLEMVTQDLNAKLNGAAAERTRIEQERGKINKQLMTVQQTADVHRSESERAAAALTEERNKFETSMAQLRKSNAGLMRERSDLQGAIEGLKGELEAAKNKTGLRRVVSSVSTTSAREIGVGDGEVGMEAEDETEEDVFGSRAARRKAGDGLSPGSPSEVLSEGDGEPSAVSPGRARGLGSSLGQATETDTLRNSLAHAQRTITTLRNALHREKEANLRTKKALSDSGWEDEGSSPETSPIKAAAGRGRGRGRGRGGASRCGAFRGTPSKLSKQVESSTEEEDEERDDSLADADGSFVEHEEEGDEPPGAAADHSDPTEFAQLEPYALPDPSPRSPVETRPLKDMLAGLGRPNDLEGLDDSRRLSSGIFSAASGFIPADLASELRSKTFADIETMTEPLPLPEPRIVEKRVEVPVEVIVEKRVEVPVERVVEVPVETIREVQVDRIVEVEKEVRVPVDRVVEKLVEVERIVEKMVEVPVERIVEQRVEVPVTVEVEKVVERRIEVPVEKIVERVVEVPVEKVVERRVEVPVERIVEVERRVEVPVDRYIEVESKAPVKVTTEQGVQALFVDGLEAETQTDATPVAITSEIGIATDAPPIGKVADTQTEATPQATLVDASHDPLTPPQSPMSPSGDLGTPMITTAVRLQRSHARQLSTLSLVRGSQTTGFESEVEGETDHDDFEDARETVGSITPSQTVTSFVQSAPQAVESALASADRIETLLAPKVTTAETGVQTDGNEPEVEETEARKRESVATFGALRRNSTASLATDASEVDLTLRPDVVAPRYVQIVGPRGGSPDPSERRQSLTSSLYSIMTDSTTQPAPRPPPVDKSKPPVLTLPPPPSVPPPRNATPRRPPVSKPLSPSPGKPIRPTSPLPTELLQRAQTPLASRLAVPDRLKQRASSSSMPSPAASRSFTPTPANMKSPVLKPKASAIGSDHSDAMSQFGTSIELGSCISKKVSYGRRRANTALSSRSRKSIDSTTSMRSRRQSFASDRTSEPGDLPVPSSLGTGNGGMSSTDPAVIHAITQTMIGEFLHKYTSKALTKGFSEKRHRRFFWVHPYTKTLYWSSSDPGAHGTNQSSAKSVYIEGVRQVEDSNILPPGLSRYSLVIQTPNREMKITATTKDRHDLWYSAINYLLSRPESSAAPEPSAAFSPKPSSIRGPLSRFQSGDNNGAFSTPPAIRSAIYGLPGSSASVDRLTPKARPSLGPNTYKRPDTAAAEFLRDYGSPRSIKSSLSPQAGDESVEFVGGDEVRSSVDDDEGFEGVENVRACCDGKHDVGSLSRHHHHHPPASYGPPARGPLAPLPAHTNEGDYGSDSPSVRSSNMASLRSRFGATSPTPSRVAKGSTAMYASPSPASTLNSKLAAPTYLNDLARYSGDLERLDGAKTSQPRSESRLSRRSIGSRDGSMYSSRRRS